MRIKLFLLIFILLGCSTPNRKVANSENQEHKEIKTYGSKNGLDGAVFAFSSEDLDEYLIDLLPIALNDAFPNQQARLINDDFLIQFSDVKGGRIAPYHERVSYRYACYRVRFLATRNTPYRKEEILETYLFVTTDLSSIKDLKHSLSKDIYTGNRVFQKTEASFEHHQEFPYARASDRRFISLVGYPKKDTVGFCSNPGLGASSLQVNISKRRVRKNQGRLEKFKKKFFRVID